MDREKFAQSIYEAIDSYSKGYNQSCLDNAFEAFDSLQSESPKHSDGIKGEIVRIIKKEKDFHKNNQDEGVGFVYGNFQKGYIEGLSFALYVLQNSSEDSPDNVNSDEINGEVVDKIKKRILIHENELECCKEMPFSTPLSKREACASRSIKELNWVLSLLQNSSNDSK